MTDMIKKEGICRALLRRRIMKWPVEAVNDVESDDDDDNHDQDDGDSDGDDTVEHTVIRGSAVSLKAKSI